MEIAKKRILVTGGAVRVGSFICRSLAEAGASVIIHCNRNLEAAEKLRNELPGTGHQIVTADFTQDGAAEECFAKAGGDNLDAIINNAAVYRLTGPRLENKRIYGLVNFAAPAKLMELLAESANPEKEKVVVNILDQELLAPTCRRNSNVDYFNAKQGLMTATLTFAKRYAANNFRCAGIAPGPMLPPAGLENSQMRQTLRQVPLNRPVPPEELARLICFILQSNVLTGAIIPLDGGQHL